MLHNIRLSSFMLHFGNKQFGLVTKHKFNGLFMYFTTNLGLALSFDLDMSGRNSSLDFLPEKVWQKIQYVHILHFLF